jgi:indolepyruvate ferredoxin oxidoreductase beta subunit
MNPFNNISDYPELEEILKDIWKLPRYVTIDAEKVAKDQGSIRAANIVVLGAASPYLDISFEKLEEAIKTVFARKGDDIVKLNLKALKAGREYAQKST